MVTQTTQGVLQPDGRVMPEATFDPKHVADTIVHIASLPNDVAVLEYKIMCVLPHICIFSELILCTGQQQLHSLVEDELACSCSRK